MRHLGDPYLVAPVAVAVTADQAESGEQPEVGEGGRAGQGEACGDGLRGEAGRLRFLSSVRMRSRVLSTGVLSMAYTSAPGRMLRSPSTLPE
ncbi:hypothetical protein SHKM778_38890 [Streptomyces sp. KM77-8]|uniref:Uncharacterized protein n=1 Tax=Streptomyces haneummycinicus TaxID=3074435 RepID=A0AAT9HJA0_9ACTN